MGQSLVSLSSFFPNFLMSSKPLMSNCIFPGGNDAEACEISVELEEKSATSYSKRTVWTLDDSNKANKRLRNIDND